MLPACSVDSSASHCSPLQRPHGNSHAAKRILPLPQPVGRLSWPEEADAAQRAAEESARRAQEQEQRRISEARQIEARARAAHMYEATVATRVSTPAPAPVKPAKVAPKAKATKATKADAKKTEAKKVPAKKAEAEVKSGRPAKAEPARASSRPAPARTASGVRAKSPAARGTKSATTTRTKSR